MFACWCRFLSKVTLYTPFPADSHFYTWGHPFTARKRLQRAFRKLQQLNLLLTNWTAWIYDWCNTFTVVRLPACDGLNFSSLHFEYIIINLKMNSVKIARINILEHSQEKNILNNNVKKQSVLQINLTWGKKWGGKSMPYIICCGTNLISNQFPYSSLSMQCDFAHDPKDVHVNCSCSKCW